VALLGAHSATACVQVLLYVTACKRVTGCAVMEVISEAQPLVARRAVPGSWPAASRDVFQQQRTPLRQARTTSCAPKLRTFIFAPDGDGGGAQGHLVTGFDSHGLVLLGRQRVSTIEGPAWRTRRV
jgi:hypothetical protein